MRCVVSPESFNPSPEGGQVFWAVVFPIWIRASEQTAMTAISPRLVIRLRSWGNRNRGWGYALLGLWEDRGEGEGRRSMILSILVNGGGASRFGLRGDSITGERPSDWDERERSGSVSSLDRGCVGRACKDGGIDDCIGGLIGEAGRKCRLGALYLGGGVTGVGVHLSSIELIGIVGHGSIIMVVSGGEANGADDFICPFPWGSYTPTRRALFPIFPFVYRDQVVGHDIGLVDPLIVSGRIAFPPYKGLLLLSLAEVAFSEDL